MNIAVIIPVYNHAQRIESVVRRCLDTGYPVFVVDDGSTDGTSAIVDGIEEITLLRHSINQGKGAALVTGFAAAFERGCSAVVTIDGDGQHLPEDMEKLVTVAAGASWSAAVRA